MRFEALEVRPRPEKTQRMVLDWADVEKLVDQVAAQLPSNIRTIVPVARGGLVPATILAYRRRIQISHVINLKLGLAMESTASDILIVDDICDSGATVSQIRQSFPGAVIAVLLATSRALESRCQFDIHGASVSNHMWVTWPWSPEDHVESLAGTRSF